MTPVSNGMTTGLSLMDAILTLFGHVFYEHRYRVTSSLVCVVCCVLCVWAGRGVGLFVGLELVTDRELRTPATEAAAQVVQR